MTTVTIPFTQADGNAANFSSLLGLTVPHVTSNAVDAPTVGTTYAGLHSTTLNANMEAAITATVTGTGTDVAVYIRADTSGNGFYIGLEPAVWFLNRLDAGTPAQLATGAVAGGSHVVKIRASGTNIRAWIDGAQIASVTDSNYSTNTSFGLILTRVSGGTLTADDMYATDVLSVPTPRVTMLAPAVHRAACW
jgi:hypothetical protein